MMQRTCLDCGMSFGEDTRYCPKCDNALDLQHDGSTITVDIAHDGERVGEALRKMQSEIDLARKGIAMCLRLVVGSGTSSRCGSSLQRRYLLRRGELLVVVLRLLSKHCSSFCFYYEYYY